MSFYWITREGEKLKPSQMGDRHLLNALRMVQNKITEFKEMNEFAFSAFAPTAEIASQDFDQMLEEMWDEEESWYAAERAFLSEAKKRGLIPLEVRKQTHLPKVKSVEYLPEGGRIMELDHGKNKPSACP